MAAAAVFAARSALAARLAATLAGVGGGGVRFMAARAGAGVAGAMATTPRATAPSTPSPPAPSPFAYGAPKTAVGDADTTPAAARERARQAAAAAYNFPHTHVSLTDYAVKGQPPLPSPPTTTTPARFARPPPATACGATVGTSAPPPPPAALPRKLRRVVESRPPPAPRSASLPSALTSAAPPPPPVLAPVHVASAEPPPVVEIIPPLPTPPPPVVPAPPPPAPPPPVVPPVVATPPQAAPPPARGVTLPYPGEGASSLSATAWAALVASGQGSALTALRHCASVVASPAAVAKLTPADGVVLLATLGWAASRGDVRPTAEWLRTIRRNHDMLGRIVAAACTPLVAAAAPGSTSPLPLRTYVWALASLFRLGTPVPAAPEAALVAGAVAAAQAAHGGVGGGAGGGWAADSNLANMTLLLSSRDRRYRTLYDSLFNGLARQLADPAVARGIVTSADDVALAGLLYALDCHLNTEWVGAKLVTLPRATAEAAAVVVAEELRRRVTAQASAAPAAPAAPTPATGDEHRYPGVPNYGTGTLLTHPDGCVAFGLFTLAATRVTCLPRDTMLGAAAEAVAAVGAGAITTRSLSALLAGLAQLGITPSAGFLNAMDAKLRSDEPALVASLTRFLRIPHASLPPAASPASGAHGEAAEGGSANSDSETAAIAAAPAPTATATTTAVPLKVAVAHLQCIPDMLWAVGRLSVSNPGLVSTLARQLSLGCVAAEAARDAAALPPPRMDTPPPPVLVVVPSGEAAAPSLPHAAARGGASGVAVASAASALGESLGAGAMVAGFGAAGRLRAEGGAPAFRRAAPHMMASLAELRTSMAAAAASDGVTLAAAGDEGAASDVDGGSAAGAAVGDSRLESEASGSASSSSSSGSGSDSGSGAEDGGSSDRVTTISAARPVASTTGNPGRSTNLLPAWVRYASDLAHAQSQLVLAATRLAVSGRAVTAMFDDVATTLPPLLAAYHRSGQAARDADAITIVAAGAAANAASGGAGASGLRGRRAGVAGAVAGPLAADRLSWATHRARELLYGSGEGGEDARVDLRRLRLRDSILKRPDYRFFPLDTADDATRYGLPMAPPLPLSVVADLATAFAARGHAAPALFAALSMHTTALLGVRSLHPLLSPSHLARFLLAAAKAKDASPVLFKAAGRYLRRTLQSPAAAAAVPPFVLVTFLRACQLARFRMPTTITAICDHLSGVHVPIDAPATSSAAASSPAAAAAAADATAAMWPSSAAIATDAATSADERPSSLRSGAGCAGAASVPPSRRVARREGGVSGFTTVELQDLLALLHQLDMRHPPLEEAIWKRLSPHSPPPAK